ncbi:reverse transcriptase domain-containing protein [Trichonephila clavipes]|uniref:Reverse transcriptase domain-containing protein n=1 Tax=Trichonephila clavipes TaxID=2585209 RepID=A0A8X6RRY7_TRICX|nr:reverse transcriptase domain-containing protein [Trichonephila clavipes]
MHVKYTVAHSPHAAMVRKFGEESGVVQVIYLRSIITKPANGLRASLKFIMTNATCRTKSDRGPRNSSRLRASISRPVVSLSFEHYAGPHIHPDTKIACYADDIALWHTHRDIAVSAKALNKTLKGIAAWAKDLKLTIKADKTNYCIFSTDRRHRGTFNADIKIEDYNIKRVIFPTYLGAILDSELRFTTHIEQTTFKALRKLNILRKLCGTTWGSRPITLKNAHSFIIRPVLENAAPIWAPKKYPLNRNWIQFNIAHLKLLLVQFPQLTTEKLKGSPSSRVEAKPCHC